MNALALFIYPWPLLRRGPIGLTDATLRSIIGVGCTSASEAVSAALGALEAMQPPALPSAYALHLDRLGRGGCLLSDDCDLLSVCHCAELLQ